MSIWAVVPLKELKFAKQRLRPFMSSHERENLVRRMFENVLSKLAEVPDIIGTVVVGGELELVPANAVYLKEPGGGLNRALRLATDRVMAMGATKVLFLPADLPLITTEDIEKILMSGQLASVVIVPDRHGQGTNALLLSPPNVMRPRFGEMSFSRHRTQANFVDASIKILNLPRIALDIDDAHSLDSFRKQNTDLPTCNFVFQTTGLIS